MKNSGQSNLTRRREPLTDTQLLLTITICIFVCMYVLAMIIWGGGFRKPQMLFDILNDNAYLVIISCGLTIVMITGSIDISVGGVVALVAMVGVMILNGNLSFFNNLIASLGLAESWRIVFAALMALLIGLAFGLVQGFLIANLEIQPFIITLAGMFFARGMITIVSVDPQKAPQNLMDILQTRIDIPWLGSVNKKGVLIPARMEIGVVIALLIVVLVFLLLRRRQLGRSFYAVGGNQQSAYIWQQSICWTFILLSGFCIPFSRRLLRRGLEVFGAGALVMLVTNLVLPEDRVIFGVLTLSTIKSIVTTSGLRDPWWQSITTGAMLSFFILLQSVVLMRKNRARAAGKKKEEKEEK